MRSESLSDGTGDELSDLSLPINAHNNWPSGLAPDGVGSDRTDSTRVKSGCVLPRNPATFKGAWAQPPIQAHLADRVRSVQEIDRTYPS